MFNKEIYCTQPDELRLLNHGVAKVSESETVKELETLHQELKTFVCKGEYAVGLERILSSFLGNLKQTEQDGVWVSGFYGSGKSHLVKMLKALWVNTKFKDKSTARETAKVPSEITDQLKELETAGKRNGGLHAAAGTLGEGRDDDVRMALLGIIFRSKGLPGDYPQACLQMRLRDEGQLEFVQEQIKKAGKEWDKELRNMYVSPHLAAALQKVDGFPDNSREIRGVLKTQYPRVDDVTHEELVDAINSALAEDGKFPLTLVVLDEVQQYIGDDPYKTYKIQETVETCSNKFKGKLLFVGTGQTSLSGTPMLQKLMGRFRVTVELKDTDIDEVLREVILAKNAKGKKELKELLESLKGEIARHLRSSKLSHKAEDDKFLVTDYPLLPVRRRFWNEIYKAVDYIGTQALLRSQLRIVLEAVKQTADLELGHVVAGDFIYEQLKNDLLKASVLPREIHNRIAEFKSSKKANDLLKGRICGMAFLIGKLPQENERNIGVQADKETLADLMVEDLAKGSGDFRKQIGSLLDELVEDGILMRIGKEYRVQTREGTDWTGEFKNHTSRLANDRKLCSFKRDEVLRDRTRLEINNISIQQGKCNEPRKSKLEFGNFEPRVEPDEIPIWVRDGWSIEPKSVLKEARQAGDQSATIYVVLPKKHAVDLDKALIASMAAEATLNSRGHQATTAGKNARDAMGGRKEDADRTVDNILDEIFSEAKCYLGGGEELAGDSLTELISEATETSMKRLFPDFRIADHPDWGNVVKRARKGDGAALEAVDHSGELDRHPVCKKILREVGAGKKGSEIRAHFNAPPFGWPRDAIDGVLYVLLATEHLGAIDRDRNPLTAQDLERSQLGKANFKPEVVTISAKQKLKIRKALKAAELPGENGAESKEAPYLYKKLEELAKDAGGEAPLPSPPSLKPFEALEKKSGSELLKTVYDLSDELLGICKEWAEMARTIEKRRPTYDALGQLLSEHSDELDEAANWIKEFEAIGEGRLLLDDPDPIASLSKTVTAALRKMLKSARDEYVKSRDKTVESLETDPTWKKLKKAQQKKILDGCRLKTPPAIETATTEDLLGSLKSTPLIYWESSQAALQDRYREALAEAAKILEPKARRISLPSRKLNDEADLEAWLKEVEDTIRKALKDGPVIL